jgi:large subunit ribosomal protein L9
MNHQTILSFFLLPLFFGNAWLGEAASWGETAAFVQVSPAARSLALSPSSPGTPVQGRTGAAARSTTGFGLYLFSDTALRAKKKAKVAAAPKKVQVKLLHHIAGTGQAGEVIQVTPAFFNNKLRPTKLAKMISNEEVEQEQAKRNEQEEVLTAKATEIQSKLAEKIVTFSRKAGPDGKLFGGIGQKNVMSELQNILKDDFLKQKFVKVSEMLDENGKKIRGDIKKTGSYAARVVLSKDISAKIEIVVKSDA